jgi:hypothetical protein
MFIFGYPIKNGSFRMSLKNRARQFRKFFNKAKLDTVQVLLPVPLPGTQLRERLKEKNRLYRTEDVGWEYYDGNFPLFDPGSDASAQEVMKSAKKIMGSFYRFKHMFMVAVHVFLFPGMVFFLHNLRLGWRTWYRRWRNSTVRFGGWITMRVWNKQIKKRSFSKKLVDAQSQLKSLSNALKSPQLSS